MRNKWTLLAFAAAIHVTYVVARSLLGVLADPIQAETGLDNVAFGVLTAAIFWTHSLVVPFAGFVGDRFNRAKLIGCAAMAWSVMTALAGFASGFWTLLLLASVAVIVPQTVFGPTTCALLSDHHVATRTVALSCHQAAYYVGWFVSGAAIAGILAVCGGTWRAAFFAVGGIGMLVALVFLLLFGTFAAPDAKAVSSEAKPTFAASLRAFFGCPTARLLAIGYIANIFVIFGYSSWAPKFVAQKFALTPAAAGTGSMFWHYAASFVAVLATGVVTDRLVKRFPRVRLAFGTGAMLLAVPAAVGFGFAPTVSLTWASAALLGFALGVFGANMVSAVYDVVPSRFRAGTVGFLNVLAAFIGSFAALMLGALSARTGTRGFELGFALMGVVTLVAALAYAAAAVFTYERDKVNCMRRSEIR